MAKSFSEEESIAALHESSNPSENNTLTEPVSRVRDKHNSRQWRRCKFRGIGSSSALLIIIWAFIISCSLSIIVKLSFYHFDINGITVKKIEGEYALGVAISLPLSSILAEVVISRYKLVRYSLRAMWFLSIVSCALTITGYSLPTAMPTLYTIRLFFPLPILAGAFVASAIPLAIDQIITGSNDNISAFIQWMVWSSAVGFMFSNALESMTYHCTHYDNHELQLMLLFFPVLLLSVGLILDFFFSHKLVQEPVTVDPVTLIFKVLKYAAKHKHPVRRSAFTYCDDQQPSRLDYGKSKYGGPFTTEQVEDVKTFWRVLLVLIVVTSFGFSLTVLSHTSSTINTRCINALRHAVTDSTAFIIYCVPVYELLVYPCLRHRGPRILQSIGIGAAALVFCSLYGLTAETIQYFTSNATTQCFFEHSLTCFNTYILFHVIIGFTILLLFKNIIEFICAQAPYNMRGLLIGVSFTAGIIFCVPGLLFHHFWNERITVLDSSRVGIWFYLTTLVFGVVSSVLLVCVIRWYKARERDEIVNYQAMVEDIYYKYQQQEALQQK